MDSPFNRFDVIKDEAESSLRWYRGPDYDIKPELHDMIKKREESLAVSFYQ